MKVLITGGAGYIGSTLVEVLLNASHRVRVLDSLCHGGDSLLAAWSHPSFELVKGDIRDVRTAREALAGMEAVVHLAAVVGDPACARVPELARAVNLDASVQLVRESRKAGVRRFIFASTCSNYGKMQDPDGVVDETSELRPVSLYAETKVAVERCVLDPSFKRDWCPTVLRFATVFGVSPRMRFDLTVNEFTAEMCLAKHLVVFGKQFWRPYAHVRDIARAVAIVLSAPEHEVHNEVYNIGATGQNYRKADLVDMIRPVAPDAVVEFVHKEEDPRDYRVCFDKLTRRLGYATTRSVRYGIEEVARLVRAGVIADYKDAKYRN